MEKVEYEVRSKELIYYWAWAIGVKNILRKCWLMLKVTWWRYCMKKKKLIMREDNDGVWSTLIIGLKMYIINTGCI